MVDTILGRRDFDETTPLKTVADDAGVSEAMVVKIAKKLGFAGFKDFRAGIVDYNRLPTAELHQELSPDDTGAEIAQKVFRTSIHALEETLSILDPEAFERAADLIFTARQRDFYGIGGSAQIARDVAPQVPADRRAHQRLRRCAHDADVGGTPRRGRRRGRLLAFGDDHRRHRAVGARPPARGPHHRADELRDLAAGRGGRRGALLDGARLAAARRERGRAHRPARHLRRGLRRRRPARPRGGRAESRRDDGCRRRQAAAPDDRTERARRRGGRQPALRHHGRRAGPAAQGRDGDRLCLAPEVRRQGRQPGRRGGEGRGRGPHGRRRRRRRVRAVPPGGARRRRRRRVACRASARTRARA